MNAIHEICVNKFPESAITNLLPGSAAFSEVQEAVLTIPIGDVFIAPKNRTEKVERYKAALGK
jgi:hypothetical protein